MLAATLLGVPLGALAAARPRSEGPVLAIVGLLQTIPSLALLAILIPLMPGELEDARPAARRAILARLARALRAERNRGRAGHWTYDLNRHIALRQAYVAERALAAT